MPGPGSGGEVQLTTEAGQRMQTELNQVTAWNARVFVDISYLRGDLSGDVAQAYQAGYPFGLQIVTDLNALCDDLTALTRKIEKMVSTSWDYAKEQAEYNKA